MEVARHVIDRFFQDVPNPLVRHHLDSFADFLSTKIPNFIRGWNSRIVRNLTDGREIRIFIGGKTGDKIKYYPRADESGAAVLPHDCRLDNSTYSFEIKATVDIDYVIGEETTTVSFDNVSVGHIPLMLKSSLCYLSPMSSSELYDAGECKFELGGYFIIGGAEKVLLTQEQLANNMFYVSKRPKTANSNPPVVGRVESEQVEIQVEGATKGEPDEYVSGIRTINETGTNGPYMHFLILPPHNARPNDPKVINKTADFADFYNRRLCIIQLPGFSKPVPVVSVFYALGLTNDKDIYDTIFAGVPDDERTMYDETFAEIMMSHEVFLRQEMKKEEDQNQDPNLLMLKRVCRTPTQAAVYVNLYNDLFSHCEPRDGESASSLYRRKAYLLGQMMKMTMDVSLNIKPKSDRDHYRYKRLYASGDLCFNEFRRIYKLIANDMLLRMDSRIEFEKQTYAGKKIVNLIKDSPNTYWKPYTMMAEFEKSFKGKWGGKDGVCQELMRLAYLGTLAMLRRVNLDMDKDTKAYGARRIHGSSWGYMCPSDNPDGGNIGMIKSMTMFCSISTATESRLLLDIVSKFATFKPLHLIHPSKFNPVWTKIYINSDMVGVFTSKANDFHYDMIQKRRSREIPKFVSLCWSQLDNEYIILTDAGRACRPLYREGVKPEAVKRIRKWDDFETKVLDFVDAQETESLRVQMEPFSETSLSELHGLTIFSASANIIPNSDHNQSVRNTFSCQQTKQACGWFNTAFNKRFDTIATWLNTPQLPLSQTWSSRHILGKDGCLGYGDNVIVALGIYTGYNQEDSIILNDNSLKRGLFDTTYYHSYDILEEMVSVMTQSHTEFANITTDPRFRETVKVQDGMDYSKLDGDGIVKVGSEIDEHTVLVGIVSPVTKDGQVVSYSDKSKKPKRGQHGRVDAVYRYTSSVRGVGNLLTILRGVKIRVAETRSPVLGDKFCSRHGQKGTCGIRISEEDMPYTASGLRPDMIVNPHAFPSRMTIGQFIETMAVKAGIELGSLVDSTPFSSQNRINELKDLLLKMGMHPYGHEIMYNGQTGEMMDAEIFIGPTYYLRLKHMVEDKINYRSRGPKTMLTHQPVEGRANDGGLRIGEMERDILISHGMSKFLNESMMERSDKAGTLLQSETGYMDSTPDQQGHKIELPYASKLFVQELESMHISTRFAS
jgi:DNA-directed RNA polymerase II subunit RPB2